MQNTGFVCNCVWHCSSKVNGTLTTLERKQRKTLHGIGFGKERVWQWEVVLVLYFILLYSYEICSIFRFESCQY